jgi:hypothetical protein
VIPIDYSSIPSLCEALCGHDAVVITVGIGGLVRQTLIIDAAIVAGIHRIIPSEFGFTTNIPKTSALPILGLKFAARKHIEEKIAQGAAITYTYVLNGPFLDRGIETGFLLDWKEGKPTLYDGGLREFSTTTLASVGQAVVGALTHEEETRNMSVYVQDIVTTQKRLLELAQKAKPEKKWEPVYETLREVEKRQSENLSRGDWSPVYEYIYLLAFGEEHGAKMERVDNELLGVKGLTEVDIEEMWKRILA